ncbi:MAG: NADH-quinone oxidoreductase subunit N [Prevotellaceae bacterium]|jgi:NADH-quinone oxidoreductase subunit N|nr:NADH-quinone oxidoreductase subunit N [Prevotellaceae bacterium]
MNYLSYLQLHDELSLLAVIVLLLIYDIFAGERAKRYFQPVAIGLFFVHTVVNCVPREAFEVSGGMYQYSPMLTYVKTILNIGTLLIFLQAHRWLSAKNIGIEANSKPALTATAGVSTRKGEFYFLTLSTLLGMYFMMSAGHFLLFFLGIETAALPMAALVAINKYQRESAEAGAKYILSSAFASGVSLFGISLLYGTAGTLYFSDLATIISTSPLAILALVLFAAGLFFKISLVPFHLWTPDVYQGAPTNITAYLSVISKGSAVFVLFVIFTKVFGNLIAQWQTMLYIMIVVSITLANIFAIRQQNIKRFLAFSSISQAGYIMLGVISGTALGMSTLVYYVLVYMFSNLAIFGVVALIENRTGKLEIRNYDGFYQTNPKLAVVMMLALFSLAGIPPFAGFFSKFFIFSAAYGQGFEVLVFIALINTIISLYYYLLVVKAMFINRNSNPIEPLKSDFAMKTSLIICTAGVIGIGLFSVIFKEIAKLGF